MAAKNQIKSLGCLSFAILLLITNGLCAQELVDPLRGVGIEKLLEEGGDIFLVRIKNAQRGAAPSFCKYDYAAEVINIYRWKNKETSKKPPEQIKFSSVVGFRVDDYALVLRNHRSDRLSPRDQKSCVEEIKKRLGQKAILLRQDELIRVYELSGDLFALLPYRYFWSSNVPVYSRETSLPKNERYTMLRMIDGHLDGDFFLLNDLLKPLTQPDKR